MATQGKGKVWIIEEEKATIASFPFTEEELQKAIDMMEKKFNAEPAKGAKRPTR